MMRQNSHLFRLSATVALGALTCNVALPVSALAQPAPAPPAVQPAQNQGDPPARVGRIAGLSGTVSFRTAGDTQWSLASSNYPVSSGNAFWTEPSAQANLEISSSRIVLAPQTEFDITTLDASGLQAVAAQGEIYLHLNDLSPDETWSVATPRGQVRVTGGGRYDIVVGTTDQPTTITALDGAAQIQGPGVSLQIAANETATITGTDPFQGSVGPAVRDAFLTARLAAERPPPRPAIAAPLAAQVYAMPGGEDLAATGSWAQAPTYGQVWYPPVAQTWVPYREGHWAYVAPWGWTWVDNAAWGFAPFHYGRWVQVEGRWGWTPGEVVVAGPPVYAPALVTFLGIGAGAAIGVGIGAALAGGSIGWVPLGPQEVYHPWYHASDAYVRQVNVRNVRNVTNITNVTNVTTVTNYVNRGAATSVPVAVMTASRPVQAAAQPVTPQQIAAARPVFGQQPVRPSAVTAGVTPAVARQLNLAPAGAAAAPRVAPGPVVRAQAVSPTGIERTPERPPLIGAHGEAPAAVRPATNAVPGVATPTAPGAATQAAPGVTPRAEPGVATPGAHGMATPGAPGVATPGAPGVATRAAPGASTLAAPGAPTPEAPREPGRTPVLAAPGQRPAGLPDVPAGRPTTTPGEARAPEAGRPAVGSATSPATAERPASAAVRPTAASPPAAPAPEVRAAPQPHAEPSRAAPIEAPRAETARPAAPVPHVEAARPAPAVRPEAAAPHVEAVRPAPAVRPEAAAPHVEAARPAPPASPHVEAARPVAPPPRVEAARPAEPPAHVEAARPAAAPPHVEAQPPHAEPARPAPRPSGREKRPGEP